MLHEVTTTEARDRLESFNPRTGEKLGEVSVASPADVAAVVARARSAQGGWAAMGVDRRNSILNRLCTVLLDRADESGKPFFLYLPYHAAYYPNDQPRLDFLKIDGSFVKEILHDPIDREMVRSINEIGHLTGKQTIAEFAENEEIITMLRGMGIDYAQGYGVSEPKRVTRAVA